MFVLYLAAAAAPESRLHDEVPLEENVNRLMVENEARNVEDAIAVLR